MKKIPFNINFRSEIEAGKFKVVTANGRPVTIQRWDMKGNYPILACTMVKQCNWEGDESWDEERPFAYDKDGHAAGTAPADKLELFLVSEESELTEFEGELKTIINTFSSCGDFMSDESLRNFGKNLLDAARKEIEKDMPKWRKSQNFEHHKAIHQIVIRDGLMFASSTKEIGEWFLDLSELEKLPKEE